MRLHGRLERHRLDSELLRDNPLGDPAERSLYVYEPPGYRDSSAAYPWVMLLAGFGGTNHSLVNYDFFEPNVIERFDRMLVAQRCPKALLVLPDAIDRWGGSQFIDSAGTGAYQSYLADEVVPWVEAHYRTHRAPEGRAVAGRSSGGFGALRLGLDRPETFGVIGSHAGDSAFDISILPELRAAAIEYRRAGGLGAFARAFLDEPRRFAFGSGLLILAYAAAYAPDPAAAYPHVAIPIDPETGVIVPDVWARFVAHDPLERMRKDDRALRSARFVYLDAGDADEHGLQFGASAMAELLRSRGVAVHHEQFPGGHRGTGHRYEVSLPLLVGACTRALAVTESR